jgi:hypothetical protein
MTDSTSKDSVTAWRDNIAIALIMNASGIRFWNRQDWCWWRSHMSSTTTHQVLNGAILVFLGHASVAHNLLNGAAAGNGNVFFDWSGRLCCHDVVFVIFVVQLNIIIVLVVFIVIDIFVRPGLFLHVHVIVLVSSSLRHFTNGLK